MPLADLRVRNVSEGNFSYTDPSGNFVVPSSGTGPVRLLAYVSGRWSNVSADQGMNLLVSSVTAPGNSVTLQFNPIGNTEFDTSQINGYYHTTRIHNWLKERVPSLTGIDIPIPTHVNIYDTCNAYYSLAASIHFFMAGPFGSYNCINTAYDTVVYHEYGHFADDMAGGIVMDTPGVGLSEGWGDVLAALESGQPLIGEGFFGVGATRAYIRTADNTYRFPGSGLDETHALGQAWSGFAWHLRQNLIAKYGQAQGIALTEDLVIPVLLANSPDIPSAFKEVILRDDDDGNPNNGTPNFDDIWEAAGRHNLQFAIPSVHIVQQVSPVYGWPGDPVTVTGSGFGPAPGWIAFYQAVLGTPTSWSDTSISVPIPAGAISGPVALHSTQFELDSNPTQFTVLSTPGPTFITVAGGGNLVFDIGDGGGATSATFRSLDIAVDAWGNIYIADADNHSIRKVAFSGVITTVAGNGIAGYSGDGGPATSASLNDPQGVAVDRSGNIYISDTRNQRIRKVDSFGVITTIAGSGVRGYGGDGGPAILAKFNWPKSLYADASGNVYVGDYSNSRIRKIDSSGVITTAAGNGLSGFYGDGGPATSAQIKNPWDVTGDVLGNLYIADTYNGRIRKVDASGIITTVAGNGIAGYSGDGGPATLASLYNPNGVAVDSSGNLYIADTYNRRIRKVEPSGIIRTVAGNGVAASDGDGGPAALARLKSPLTAATRGKEVYVLDGTGRVRWLTSFDQTPPAVTITAPADGALLGDIVTVEAAASDDVGMLGVQFKLDGQNLGSQDTSPPYTISWNTRDVSDKTYTLTAVARDLSDNVAQHSISVVVDNYYRKDQPCLAGGSGYAPSLAKPCVPTYQLEGISVLDFSAQGTGRPALLTPNADGVRDGVGFLGAKSVKILNLEGRVIKTLSGDGSLLIWHPGRDSYSPESGIYMAVDENSRKILPILIVK
ncbi:MAG: hypothetical protein HY400_07580 [Elusimicrobia bacterium]|nr:hypothetical protein [Elusimicrobiota bacterium]